MGTGKKHSEARGKPQGVNLNNSERSGGKRRLIPTFSLVKPSSNTLKLMDKELLS